MAGGGRWCKAAASRQPHPERPPRIAGNSPGPSGLGGATAWPEHGSHRALGARPTGNVGKKSGLAGGGRQALQPVALARGRELSKDQLSKGPQSSGSPRRPPPRTPAGIRSGILGGRSLPMRLPAGGCPLAALLCALPCGCSTRLPDHHGLPRDRCGELRHEEGHTGETEAILGGGLARSCSQAESDGCWRMTAGLGGQPKHQVVAHHARPQPGVDAIKHAAVARQQAA